MLELSLADNELFCTLDLTANPAAQAMQNDLAGELAQVFKVGNKNCARDIWKAEQYLNFNKTPPGMVPRSSLFRTKTFYTLSSKYGFFRIYLLRIDAIVGYFANSFLPSLFSFGGLSHGLNFIFDLGVVFYSTFKHADGNQSKLNVFMNHLKKDGRPARMVNSAIWFSINLTGIIITGGAWLLFLSFAVMALDTCNTIHNIWKAHQNNIKFVKHFSDKLAIKEQELKALQFKHENSLFISHLISANEGEKIIEQRKKLDILKNEVAMLSHIRTQSELKVKADIRDQIYSFLISLVVCGGFVLSCLPPTLLPGIILTMVGVAIDTFSPLIKSIGKVTNKMLAPPVLKPTPTTQVANIVKEPLARNSYSSHLQILNSQTTNLNQEQPVAPSQSIIDSTAKKQPHDSKIKKWLRLKWYVKPVKDPIVEKIKYDQVGWAMKK